LVDFYHSMATVGGYRVSNFPFDPNYSDVLDELYQLSFTLALEEMLKQFSIGLMLSLHPFGLFLNKQLKLSPECMKYLIIDLQIISHTSLNKRFADVFNKTKLLKSIRSLNMKVRM